MPFGRHASTEKQLFGIIPFILIINQLLIKEGNRAFLYNKTQGRLM